MKSIQNIISYSIVLMVLIAMAAGRPSSGDINQDIELAEQADYDDGRNGGYEMPSLPIEHLKYFIAHYKPNAYLRSPLYNEYIHSPEIKRQVRYRQCYFNPISCFKK